ncbi:carboxy methyl transferase for protein phosphatase 2A [Tilletia horrida]|nr:carboxy methyl transferase for protein phosphatase 2A [Tilletia horrida]
MTAAGQEAAGEQQDRRAAASSAGALRDPLALFSSDEHPFAPPPPPSARLSLGTPRSRRPPQAATASAASSQQQQQQQQQLPHSSAADAAVRATDSDALLSRLSALEAGYMPPDPFAALFLSARPTPPLLPPSGTAAAVVPAPSPPAHAHAPPGRSYSPPPFASPFGPRPGSAAPEPNGSGGGTAAATAGTTSTRRPPVLNIGTYLRCTALDRVVNAFLEQSAPGGAHIISIGAGSDSRFWRIQADSKLRSHLAHYTELDFREITKAKVQSINKSSALTSALQPVIDEKAQPGAAGVHLDADRGIVTSAEYSLFPCDLRTLATESSGDEPSAYEQLRAHIREFSQPGASSASLQAQLRCRTLVLAECVLAYLEPRDADALLLWFASLARPAGAGSGDGGRNQTGGSEVLILSFDMCVEGSGQEPVGGEGGRFGRMMLQNIESRGLPLHGARAYSTPSAYTRRYQRILESAAAAAAKAGRAQAPSRTTALQVRTGTKTLTQLWRELDGAEKQRISRLERLDEVEELEMLMDHYCICWGSLELAAGQIPL